LRALQSAIVRRLMSCPITLWILNVICDIIEVCSKCKTREVNG
jgi:hypothetical protein